MRSILHAAPIIALAAIGLVGSCGANGPGDGPDDPTDTTTVMPPKSVQLSFGSVKVQAELATTLAERELGLMNRASVPDTAGMLFVFAQDQSLSFWMKDTRVNLAIAFLDSTRTILNIEEMTAFDEVTYHRSSGLARYALEVRQGWFSDHGVVAGTKATFTLPPGLTIAP